MRNGANVIYVAQLSKVSVGATWMRCIVTAIRCSMKIDHGIIEVEGRTNDVS
jgi:hypothetical protein